MSAIRLKDSVRRRRRVAADGEAMIEQGRVTVNGKVVTELDAQAEPSIDEIKVDGRRLPRAKANQHPPEQAARLHHQPLDPKHRATVIDLLAKGACTVTSIPLAVSTTILKGCSC